MDQEVLRRFLFTVDRVTLSDDAAPVEDALNAKLRVYLPDDICSLSRSCDPHALPAKGYFETPSPMGVQKGDTELVPMKFEVQFVSSIQMLMDVINAGALLTIEVFHSNRRAGDHIVGRAHVPMQPLLSETWVQGKAPVWANMYDPAEDPPEEEEVQVATLGIRISLEDITAISGLMPAGKTVPPLVSITPADAQSPPPPPRVPTTLPTTPPQHTPPASPSPDVLVPLDTRMPIPGDNECMPRATPPLPHHAAAEMVPVATVPHLNQPPPQPNATLLSPALPHVDPHPDAGLAATFGVSNTAAPGATSTTMPGLPSAAAATEPVEPPQPRESIPRSSLSVTPHSEVETGVSAAAEGGVMPATAQLPPANPATHGPSHNESPSGSATHSAAASASPDAASAVPNKATPPRAHSCTTAAVHTTGSLSPHSAAQDSPPQGAALSPPAALGLESQPSMIPRPQRLHASATSTSASVRRSYQRAPTHAADDMSRSQAQAAPMPPQRTAGGTQIQSPHSVLPSGSNQSATAVVGTDGPDSYAAQSLRPPHPAANREASPCEPVSSQGVRVRKDSTVHMTTASSPVAHSRPYGLSLPGHSATEALAQLRKVPEDAHMRHDPHTIPAGMHVPQHVLEDAHMRPAEQDLANAHMRPPMPLPAALASRAAPGHLIEASSAEVQGQVLDQGRRDPGQSWPAQAVAPDPHDHLTVTTVMPDFPSDTDVNLSPPWPHVRSSGSLARSAEAQAEAARARVLAEEKAAAAAAEAQKVAAFEDWKRGRHQAWRRDVVVSETEEMAALEAAWAEREAARQRDIAEAVARVDALKSQVLQKAEDLEAREARLLAAEEAALRHKDDLEATSAARAEEAQAAIARLQAEFAHQLAVEQARNSELALQRGHAQQELESAQAEAKRKRSELQAAQAEAPAAARDGLRADIAAAQRRTAEAERRRCEAEAIAAEFCSQVELLAQQLEEAHAMQRRAREATSRAVLATEASAAAPAKDPTVSTALVADFSAAHANIAKTAVQLRDMTAAGDAASSGCVGKGDGDASAKNPEMVPTALPVQLHSNVATSSAHEDEGTVDASRAGLADAGHATDAGQVATAEHHISPGGEKHPDDALDVEADMENCGLQQPTRASVAHQGATGGKSNVTEVKRLFQERSKLLATGCYTMDDVLITRISDRISLLSTGM